MTLTLFGVRVPRWLVAVREDADGLRFAIGEAGSDAAEAELVRGAFQQGCAFVLRLDKRPSVDQVRDAIMARTSLQDLPGASAIYLPPEAARELQATPWRSA